MQLITDYWSVTSVVSTTSRIVHHHIPTTAWGTKDKTHLRRLLIWFLHHWQWTQPGRSPLPHLLSLLQHRPSWDPDRKEWWIGGTFCWWQFHPSGWKGFPDHPCHDMRHDQSTARHQWVGSQPQLHFWYQEISTLWPIMPMNPCTIQAKETHPRTMSRHDSKWTLNQVTAGSQVIGNPHWQWVEMEGASSGSTGEGSRLVDTVWTTGEGFQGSGYKTYMAAIHFCCHTEDILWRWHLSSPYTAQPWSDTQKGQSSSSHQAQIHPAMSSNYDHGCHGNHSGRSTWCTCRPSSHPPTYW